MRLRMISGNELIEFETQSERLLEATLDMEKKWLRNIWIKFTTSMLPLYSTDNENPLVVCCHRIYFGHEQISILSLYVKCQQAEGFADFVFIPKQEYVMDYPALVVELNGIKT